MRLYIKEELFQTFPRFIVKDENGNDKYDVHTKPAAVMVGLKLHICDMAGTEVGFIDQKALSLQSTFRLHVDGVQKATVAKKFTFLKPKYEVKELGWTIQGDFIAHNYTVTDAHGVVASIHKELFSWGDSFVLDLLDPAHELEALTVVFAIDCVVDSEGSGFQFKSN